LHFGSRNPAQMDYALANLSPRSFEHLVQTLALKYFGLGGIVFGDGPDGGREATFAGETKYDTGNGPWTGYVVLQAKFRQKPLGAPSDGDWLHKELRSELSEFTKQDSPRQKPDYYLLVTNVVLTPPQDTGSKDKAFQLLRTANLDLIECDIWDYDKLRALLDLAPEITRRYAAWITAGDVLHAVVQQIDRAIPNFDRTLSRFLQNEIWIDQYANLEQGGHNPEERVPMARVFVDLPVADPSKTDDADSGSPFIAAVLETARERLAPSCVATDGDSPAGDRGTKPLPGRSVLIGGPGQGKTTLGQFVCQLFRASILLGRDEPSVDPDVLAVARNVEAWCQKDGYELPAVRRFPLRVALSELAAELARDSAVSTLLDYIAHRIGDSVAVDLDAALFRDWLAAYPWLLILDGLDEVPPSSNRDEVIAAVRGFMIEVADSDADVLVIATTRPQGYSEDFTSRVYRHQWLKPLGSDEALGYAARLAEVRFGENPQRQEKVMARLRSAVRSETTARLMTSPLQVTIMTILVDRQGHPPQERWTLFSAYYEAIYARELERDFPTSRVLREQRTNVNEIHRRLALVLQAESERLGGTDARMSVARFRQLVRDRLADEGYVGDALAAVEGQIVEAAAHRLVFVVGLESDRVGFEIRSLQEFMAAEALMEGGDSAVRERLSAVAASPSWRNVFLFAAGKCFAERQHLRDSVHTICASLNESGDRSLENILAGSRLAVDLLDEGTVRQQPKYAQLFARLALRLLDLPASPAHERLAGAYHESVARLFQEEIARRIGAGDYIDNHGTWTTVVILANRDVDWAFEVCTSKWPEDGSKLLAGLADERPPAPRMRTFLDSQMLRQPIWRAAAYDGRAARRARRSASLFGRLLQAPTAHRRPMIALRPGRGELMVRVAVTSPEGLRQPRTVVELPDWADPSWQSLTKVAEFSTSPSPQSAAAVLRSLLPVAEFLPTRTRTAVFPLPSKLNLFTSWPWPVTALFFTALGPEDVEGRAARLEAGDFGSAEDWRAAEETWRRTEYNLFELADRCDPDAPLVFAGGVLDPPLALLQRYPQGGYTAITSSMIERISRLRPWARAVVADVVLQAIDLASFELEDVEPWQLTVRQLRDLVQWAGGSSALSSRLLEKMLVDRPVGEDDLPYIDDLSSRLAMSAYNVPASETPLRELAVQALRQDAARPGMIKLLALTGRSADASELGLAGPAAGCDDELSFARFILQLRPRAERATAYAPDLLRFARRVVTRIDIVLRAAVRDGASHEWCEELLTELLAIAPDGCARLRGKALRSLDDLVDRRLSQLADEQQWLTLELFPPPSDGSAATPASV